jgi:hypothetical protein
MLIHTVLIAPASSEAEADIHAAFMILADLDVDGMLEIHHGPNRDYEGKSERYQYGFTVFFRDREAHLAYERHPEHQRAGGMLVASAAGGHDGIFVFDLEVADPA